MRGGVLITLIMKNKYFILHHYTLFKKTFNTYFIFTHCMYLQKNTQKYTICECYG